MSRSAVHDTFTIERSFDVPPARVFAAFANPEIKARWFIGPPGSWTLLERVHDFRVGGRERVRGKFAAGRVSDFEAHFYDIVPDVRIVYGYEMHIDERRISVSLATIQLEPAGKGTRVLVTEQGVFLDGLDEPSARVGGTGGLLDRLDAVLRSS